MINYFNKALHNQYIALSIGKCNIRDHEAGYEQDTFLDIVDSIPQKDGEMEESILYETMRQTLTERESLCVQRIVLEGWTAEAVAEELGITKQAVNQCKKRALDKLKTVFN